MDYFTLGIVCGAVLFPILVFTGYRLVSRAVSFVLYGGSGSSSNA